MSDKLKTQYAQCYGWKCHYCGIEIHASTGIKAVLSERVPGIKWVCNLVLACEFCKRAKGNHSYASFKNWLDKIRKV